MNIITNKTILRKMADMNLIKWPVDKDFPYVDEIDNKLTFVFDNKTYCLRYVDGCFYPFVYDITNTLTPRK